jgi:Zn-dependent protease with chaperone function
VFAADGSTEAVAGIATSAALLWLLIILGASAYKGLVLRGGGGVVARALGGTRVDRDVSDPLLRRLRNVVEEMAIASGVPVPEVYVLEGEAGLNAFAAGHSPANAAVAVTRGTVERLSRDELQGVVAHEFSHILNGDMRLNIRLMGWLFGLLAIVSSCARRRAAAARRAR